MSLDLVNVYAGLFVEACSGILISFCQLLALVVIAIGVIRANQRFPPKTVERDRLSVLLHQNIEKLRIGNGDTASACRIKAASPDWHRRILSF